MNQVQSCRDCSKCTERPGWKGLKAGLNGLLMLCTFGISVLVSGMYRSGRKVCPVCGHPLSWHSRSSEGHFRD